MFAKLSGQKPAIILSKAQVAAFNYQTSIYRQITAARLPGDISLRKVADVNAIVVARQSALPLRPFGVTNDMEIDVSDPLNALRERFQRAPGQVPVRRRRRLNLRLSADHLAKLRRIRVATGQDQNSFCCAVLIPAIERAHDELQKQYDEAGWSIIERCAERNA